MVELQLPTDIGGYSFSCSEYKFFIDVFWEKRISSPGLFPHMETTEDHSGSETVQVDLT